jgi:hypothetical protein
MDCRTYWRTCTKRCRQFDRVIKNGPIWVGFLHNGAPALSEWLQDVSPSLHHPFPFLKATTVEGRRQPLFIVASSLAASQTCGLALQHADKLRPRLLLRFGIGERGIQVERDQAPVADLKYQGLANQRRGGPDSFTKVRARVELIGRFTVGVIIVSSRPVSTGNK